jgi:hypothetical protein
MACDRFVLVKELAKLWIKMDELHVLSVSALPSTIDEELHNEGESHDSVSALPSRKEEELHNEGENAVDFDRVVIPVLGKKSTEILIDIDANRKKIITLDDDNKNLEEIFFKAIAEDATLKEYVDSAVIFQIFNHKFNTWVDLDRLKELSDGTHLKAIFQAKIDGGIDQCHTSKKSKKETITIPVCSVHVGSSTQFDGQDDQKSEMKTGTTGSMCKEQISGSNSPPTISQGLLFIGY